MVARRVRDGTTGTVAAACDDTVVQRNGWRWEDAEVMVAWFGGEAKDTADQMGMYSLVRIISLCKSHLAYEHWAMGATVLG